MEEELRKELKVTSLEQLKSYKGSALVELPPFAQGQPFVARLKRPSMFGLIKAGKIPNELIVQANKLFVSGSQVLRTNVMNPEMFDELFSIIDVFCEESFVEPTYKQLKDAGIELSDQQKLFIFGYSQDGVEALKSFR